MYDRPGSEAIRPLSIRISTKPPLTHGARFRPEREPHVIAVALDLIQRIDIRFSEVSKNQATGMQLRHALLSMREMKRHAPFALNSTTGITRVVCF